MFDVDKKWIKDNLEYLPVGKDQVVNGVMLHGEPWKPICFDNTDMVPSEQNAIYRSSEIVEEENWDDFVYFGPGEGNDQPYGVSVFFKETKEDIDNGIDDNYITSIIGDLRPDLIDLYDKTEETNKEHGIIVTVKNSSIEKDEFVGQEGHISFGNKHRKYEEDIKLVAEFHTHPNRNIGFSKGDWIHLSNYMIEHPEDTYHKRVWGVVGRRYMEDTPILHYIVTKDRVNRMSVEDQRELITDIKNKVKGLSRITMNRMWDVVDPYFEELYYDLGGS